MERKIVMLLYLCTLASVFLSGCGLGGQGKKGEHAKEIESSQGVCIDYEELSKLSMEPVQQFSYQLFLNSMEKDNPVLSPVSAYIAMCIVGNGAEGETKQQLLKALGGDIMCIPDGLMNTLPQDGKEGARLSVANSAWLDKAFTADKEWVGIANSLFDAQIYQADLDTETVKGDMNDWVSKHTEGMIPQLLLNPLEETARVAVINALYFDADWQNKFDKAFTRERDFHCADGSVEEVPMMHMLYFGCSYYQDRDAQGIILPYQGGKFAFAAIKPTGGKSIREWLGSVSAQGLRRLMQTGAGEDVYLALPEFEARCKGGLIENLRKIGIIDAFDPDKANFTSIGKSKDGMQLYISEVLQEAVIKVSEEGTEAAAATMVGMDSGSAMEKEPKEVEFDCPFFYMVFDTETCVPLFMGIFDKLQS